MAPVSTVDQLTPEQTRQHVLDQMKIMQTAVDPKDTAKTLRNCGTRMLWGLWAVNGIDPSQQHVDFHLGLLCGLSLLVEKLHFEEGERIARFVEYAQLEFDI